MRCLAFSHSKLKSLVLSPLLVVLALLFSNCAASNPGQVEQHGSQAGGVELKQIHTVAVTEDDQQTILSIGGSTDLLFSDIRKTAPPTVSFYFPGTEFADIQALYQVDAPPIKDIRTSEVVADGHTAKITVNLLQDAAYNVNQDEHGITVSFSRDVVIEEKELPAETTAATEEPVLTSETIDPAVLEAASKGTCIEMVDFKEQSDGVEIVILADGTITDYSAFTVDNPPRIVFDIYDINSPYKGLQKIEVESKWVQGVRHFCYPEKLRVVLDTDRSYLTSFTSKPIKNGLLISVAETKPLLDDALVQTVAADTTAPAAPAPQMAEAIIVDETMDSAPAAETEPVIELAAAHETPETPSQEDQGVIQSEGAPADTQSQPAWLNKLEFTSIEEGASLVSIGTTNPVRYDMARISDRKLQLKLFNTRIPQYRKRPLITTRFKSAVDRITPIETDQTTDHALVVFELREGVPFEITGVGFGGPQLLAFHASVQLG